MATKMRDPFARKEKPEMKKGEAIEARPGFTFGCDPEFFILNGDGKLVTAAGLIPGTKEEPHKVERGAVQVDGMAAEFNIDPCSTFKEFDESITAVMKQLKGFLPVGYSFHIVPSVQFDPEVFDAAPDEAKELGCNPDFNAWTGNVNPPPCAPDDPYLRTASGHIHIGWGTDFENSDVQHILNCCDMVKQLDWFLGAWSLSQDPDPVRRKLYGKAGAYRPKPYGVEYRVLSNFWIKSSEMRLQIWNRLQTAIRDMQKNFLPDVYGRDWNEMLVESVNESQLRREISTNMTYPVKTIDLPDPLDIYKASKRKLFTSPPMEDLQTFSAQYLNQVTNNNPFTGQGTNG